MPSSRRRVLALGAGLVATVAGCVSESPGDTPTDETPTDTDPKKSPSGTPTDPPKDAQRDVGGVTLALTDVAVHEAVRYEAMMGSGGVAAAEGRQYVVASVHSSATLSMAAFSLAAGDGSWTASVPGDRGGGTWSVAGHDGGPVGEANGGTGPRFVAFEVPSPLDADAAEIRFSRDGESAAWSLGDDAVAALGEPGPTFRLDSLAAPDAVSQGDAMDVSLSVTNTSDADGRFLAAVYWPTKLIADDDESHLVAGDVAAGESATLSTSIETKYTTNEREELELSVAGYVSASTTVLVTDASTPT